MAETKLWYLVCYDIRDEKRWRKAYRIVKGYGESIQYSIVRCRLSAKEIERLRWELEQVLDPIDSLLIVGLCDGCSARVTAKNRPESWDGAPPPRFTIV